LHEEGISEIPKQFSWKINKKNIEDIESDLAYSISAVDSIGQISNSKTKRIPVLVKDIAGKKRLGEVDREFEYYSLILFDYGKSELGYEHKKVVDFVKDRVNTNSKISIYGFTDSMGDIDVNQRLSEKRAKSVLQRLNISNDPLVEGKGETQLLYDNTLPEGRFYCRTVTIDIETPVVNNR
jgi:outer membrane protein OmpA-like peptidoglycan-associated protein